MRLLGRCRIAVGDVAVNVDEPGHHGLTAGVDDLVGPLSLGKGYGLCGGADELYLISDDENRGVWFDRRAGCVEQVAAGDTIAGHGDYPPMDRLSASAAGKSRIRCWPWLVGIWRGNVPGGKSSP